MSVQSPPAGGSAVLITGGGTGIGRAVAEKVLREGGKVAVTGRREAPLESLVHAHGAQRVVALPGDLAEPSFRADLLRRAGERLGGVLDGFVHSAGLVVHEAPGAISEGALREQLELHLVAPLRLGEQALAELPPGGGMVFISSTLARRPIVTSAAYSAGKAGMLAVMKAFAAAGAPKGIRANAVSPGGVDTDMVAARRDALVGLHPLGRLGRADEIAAAVWHLLTAPWTTGSELVVDGGLLLRE